MKMQVLITAGGANNGQEYVDIVTLYEMLLSLLTLVRKQ